jgi:uncharacterized protein (TIGR03083 family)
MTIVAREDAIAALDAAYDGIVGVAEDLAPDEWALPTACPGWTVQDNVSHVIGIESLLLGRPTPDVSLPDELPHVRNDLGRANEVWVEARRSASPDEVFDELRSVLAERRAAVAGMDQAAFDAEAMTPAGPDTYGRFMRVRVMDIWFHEQDIREAVGRPGHVEGVAPATALTEATLPLGFVVGKRAAAPAGSTVRFELTGPMARRVDIEVGDRARIVDSLTGDPDVTLTVPGHYFTRLAGGRGADPRRVEISGDAALGERVVASLGYMI